jgi:hypothetical protein
LRSTSTLVTSSSLLLLFACGAPSNGGDDDDDQPDAPPPTADATPRPDAACTGMEEAHMLGVGTHVPNGSPITWNSNPPSSGPHYNMWARWGQTYTTPLDRGNWVHNLEHGGIVVTYNCSGCDAEVQAIEDLLAGLPQDSLCTGGIRTRTIITADPLLPPGVRFAASAWDAPSSFGWTWTAACADTDGLAAFIADHYGHGPEATCAQGQVP